MDPYLIRALEMTPRLVENELKRGSDFDVRPHADRFSMREVVAHLADWEPIMLTRIQTGVHTPGSDILAYDEGEMAVTNRYSETDPFERLRTWKSDRAKTIEYVSGLTDEDFAKPVVHPERGPMLVGDIAHMLVSHDIYHLDQLAEMTHEKTVDTW